MWYLKKSINRQYQKSKYKCQCPYIFLKQNTSTNVVQISTARRIGNRLWYNKNLR